MSNLLKSFALVCNDDKRIIDSNEAVTIKLQEIRKIMTESNSKKEGFTLGINPESVGELLDEGQQEEGQSEVLLSQEEVNKKAEDILEEAGLKAKEITDTAKMDALNIVDEAKKQAEKIKQNAYQEGFEAGSMAGKQQTENELQKLNGEYEKKKAELDRQYKEKLDNIEPELVDVILDVFSSVTKAVSVEQKDMIMGLIDKVLSGTEASNNYIIKTSSEDAEFLRENKENIIKNVDRDINIEIVEDVSMKKNECLIDTDFGIYDCGLDIQLENLMRAIRILSCTAGK